MFGISQFLLTGLFRKKYEQICFIYFFIYEDLDEIWMKFSGGNLKDWAWPKKEVIRFCFRSNPTDNPRQSAVRTYETGFRS